MRNCKTTSNSHFENKGNQKTPVARSIFIIITWIIFLQLGCLARAQIHVEQVQRDFQVRYHLLTASVLADSPAYLSWPACGDGTGAPPSFPKDGYYNSLDLDLNLATQLVQDLARKFYSDAIIYTNFVKTTNGLAGLIGVSNINNFCLGDMVSPVDVDAITTNNYLEVLTSISSNINLLTLMKVSATQTTTSSDVRDIDFSGETVPAPSGGSGLIDGSLVAHMCRRRDPCDILFTPNYSDTTNDAIANLPTEWGTDYEAGYDQSGDGEVYIHDGSPVANKIGCIFESFSYQENYSSCDGINQEYGVYVKSERGRITADLTSFSKGTAFVFLKLGIPTFNLEMPDDDIHLATYTAYFAQAPPTSAPTNTFGLWSNGTMPLGGVSSSGYISNATSIPAAIGTEVQWTDELYGWEVDDQLVIVAPDFTVIPDTQCCASCSHCAGGTDEQASVNSVHYSVGLGNDNFGNSAGSLHIDADFPSLLLYSPASLRYFLGTNVSALFGPDGMIRQFKSSQLLVDIATNGCTNYSMSYYVTADAGSTNGYGIYVPTGSPYTTITVENPDASVTVTNRLRMINVTDGNTNVTEYNYNSANNQWSLSTGNGLRIETHAYAWDVSNTVKTDTMTVSNAAGQLVYKEVDTYIQYPWGQEMVTNIVDPDGAALTSSWVFYTNAATDGGNYRQLKQQIDASGHWITHQYDQYGRETNQVEQFLDSAVGSATNLNRVTRTIYSTSPPQITTIKSLLEAEVGRSYEVLDIGLVEDIQCQTAGADWATAADDLVTITKQYTSGSFANQPQSVQYPNGTVALYSYSTNSTQKTTVILTGQPDPSSSTNILAGGTVTTVVTGMGGQTISSTTQYKIASSSYITTSTDSYTYLDSQNRSYKVVHLDGTSNYVFYACCGMDSQIDADGVMTTYEYDGLKHQIASTRNGTTISNVYDALGNALITIRNPGASQIVQHGAVYDLGGRLMQETNALGGVTSYSNYFDGSGQLVKVTTNADLVGTRIETYAQDGSLLNVSGTAARPVHYLYGVDGDGAYRATVKDNPLNGSTNEWTKVSTDMVGRPYKSTYPSGLGNHASTSYFNNMGQLSKEVDPDGITTLYTYNGLGQPDLTAVDINQNGSIDTSGPDRISETIADVLNDGTVGADVQRTRNYAYVDGSSTPMLVSMNETSTDGLKSWNTVYNNGNPIMSQSVTIYLMGGYRYQTNIAVDNSYAVSTYLNGQLISVVQKDAGNNPIGGTTYGYDSFGRQNNSLDSRNGTSTYYFNKANQRSGMLSPSPDGILSGQVTSNFFDNMGRLTGTLLSDTTAITNLYYPTGDLMLTHGSQTYPVGYSYDAQGRIKYMTNWSSFSTLTGARVTTWNYDSYQGFLSGKNYDNGGSSGPSYSYTPAGRLNTRTWARGTITSYAYNTAGDLSTVLYSDGFTPGITNGYDRRGRETIVTNGTAICDLTYNDVNQLLSESYTGGPLDTVSVTNGYDSLLPRTNCVTRVGSAVVSIATNNYDAASRLNLVSDGTNSATYSYLANSPLVQYITFKQSGTTRMTTMKSYDYLNRLTGISSANASSVVLDSHKYAYNSANQRTAVTNADNTRWNYYYDTLGQVTAGSNYWGDGTVVAGRQYNYAFDDVGNRTGSSFGGDASGNNLRSASYSINDLNQYTSRTVPGYLEIDGQATNTATVTVNGQSTYRKTNYYWAEVTVANSSSPVLQEVTNKAVLPPGPNGTITGSTFVPKTPEGFWYDADGNLLSDGRWTNVWDAENRLISMTNLSTAPAGSELELDFNYDYQGRRIQKTVSIWNGSSYTPQSTNRFAYDGWDMLAVLSPALSVAESFMWGADLGGSIQDIGGVDGLLKVSVGGTNGFVSSDGNGNVCALASAVDGTVLAQYEYGPFGELVRANSALALLNPMRFSAQYQDDETKLIYFGLRYYSSSIGKWLSRDPIEEAGGKNLYGFCMNSPVDNSDLLGLVSQADCVNDAKSRFLFEIGQALRNFQIDRDTLSGNASEQYSYEREAQLYGDIFKTVATAGAGAVAGGIVKLARFRQVTFAAGELAEAGSLARAGQISVDVVGHAGYLLSREQAFQNAAISLSEFGTGVLATAMTADGFEDAGADLVTRYAFMEPSLISGLVDAGQTAIASEVIAVRTETKILEGIVPGIDAAGNLYIRELQKVGDRFKKRLDECKCAH